MNYKKLLQGISVVEFEEMAENWYQRTHKLLDAIKDGKEKAAKLHAIMVARMAAVTTIYLELEKKRQQIPNYPLGTENKAGIGVIGEHPIGEYIMNPDGSATKI